MPARTDTSALLPEALADALGQQLAEAQKAWARDLEVIKATSLATIAELKAQVADLTAQLRAVVDGEVSRVSVAIAGIKDGAPGSDGAPGKDGAPGRDGAAGKDGASGRDGTDGKDGAPGKDGVGLAGALIDRAGNLVVTLSDGTTRDLGPVVGRDGTPGRDGERGEPGFSLTHFDVKLQKDGRTIEFTFAGGDRVETHEMRFPVMAYRGVFKEGEAYQRGDCVTFGGSVWHCNAETTEKPGEGTDAWTLAVKRGRDGKAGAEGKKGDAGAPGRPGRDLTLEGTQRW